MNDNQVDRFSKARVCVTLTGEEWFAFVAHTAEKPLSPKGIKLYVEASKKIQQQLIRASNSFRMGEAQ